MGCRWPGDGGLLAKLTKLVLEAGLEAEMSTHLGYDKHAVAGRGGGNSRNGTRTKTGAHPTWGRSRSMCPGPGRVVHAG
jgi:hypothetical protein